MTTDPMTVRATILRVRKDAQARGLRGLSYCYGDSVIRLGNEALTLMCAGKPAEVSP